MRKSFCKLVGTLIVFVFSSFLASAQFFDVEGIEYQESIETLELRGVINGYDDGSFKPDNSINRAEFLKIVMSSADLETLAEENCFPDVPSDSWFSEYVCSASSLGVVNGYPDGTFKPGKAISFVEAFSIVVKTFELQVAPPGGDDQWYRPLVRFFHDASVFSKYSYLPSREINRAESAHLLYKTLLDEEEVERFSVFRNIQSEGCGVFPPTSSITTFNVNGEQRSAIVHFPDDYNQNNPYPIIFAYHGRTSSNQRVQSYFGLDRAVGNNAIVVYPAGTPNGSSSYSWSPGKDYEFFDVMFDTYKKNYCINEDQVFIVGHSLGAWFGNNLACVRGDLIRGVATLGGSRTEVNCSGPVAAMVWHNPQDNLVPFSDGDNAKNLFLSQNSCNYESFSVEPSSGSCKQFSGCMADSPVVWCPHTTDTYSHGAFTPHTWPRGTGRYMWEFFKGLN